MRFKLKKELVKKKSTNLLISNLVRYFTRPFYKRKYKIISIIKLKNL